MTLPASPSDADGPPAPGSRAARLASLRRQLLLVSAACVSIALLLSSFPGARLGVNLVYSFAVGGGCWLFTELLRSAVLALTRRQRAARGLPADETRSLGLLTMLPIGLVSVLAGAPLGLTIGDWLTGLRSASLMAWQTPVARVTLIVSVIASAVIVFTVTTLERLAAARAEAEAAQRRATETQLKLLESQLEPHMLFNTLANLRVLIGLDPPRAQAMLDHLISFLRATLNASRTGAHTLAAEFERVADYLALMSLRMGPRLSVQLDLPQSLRTAAMPPLLLQPLVENSIRHGLEPQVAPGRIEVSARVDGASLVLRVRDTGVGLAAAGAPTPPSESTNFGLEQIRARLAALYGANASFTLTRCDDALGGTLAQITLPLSMMDAS